MPRYPRARLIWAVLTPRQRLVSFFLNYYRFVFSVSFVCLLSQTTSKCLNDRFNDRVLYCFFVCLSAKFAVSASSFVSVDVNLTAYGWVSQTICSTLLLLTEDNVIPTKWFSLRCNQYISHILTPKHHTHYVIRTNQKIHPFQPQQECTKTNNT